MMVNQYEVKSNKISLRYVMFHSVFILFRPNAPGYRAFTTTSISLLISTQPKYTL